MSQKLGLILGGLSENASFSCACAKSLLRVFGGFQTDSHTGKHQSGNNAGAMSGMTILRRTKLSAPTLPQQTFVAHSELVLARGVGSRICVTVRLRVQHCAGTWHWLSDGNRPFPAPPFNLPELCAVPGAGPLGTPNLTGTTSWYRVPFKSPNRTLFQKLNSSSMQIYALLPQNKQTSTQVQINSALLIAQNAVENLHSQQNGY